MVSFRTCRRPLFPINQFLGWDFFCQILQHDGSNNVCVKPISTQSAPKFELIFLQVDPSEIGIISPYRRQVQKIRDLMNRKFQHKHEFRDWKNITVGSTEEFQVNTRQCFALDSVLFLKDKSPEVLFHGITWPYSYFEVGNLNFCANSARSKT